MAEKDLQEVIVLRHGVTDWNQQKRIQGRTDISLAVEGISVLQQYTLPAQWHQYCWLCSPLLRARQTAEVLGLTYQVEPALIEMSWGEWEGGIIAELRQSVAGFSVLEKMGLDLQPPQGESPRMVQQRLQGWILDYCARQLAAQPLATIQQPTVLGVVTHKGIIRALLAAATGWDMTGKPPVKLDYKAAQRFGWDQQQQRWQLVEANAYLLRT